MQFRYPKSKTRSGASASGAIQNQNGWIDGSLYPDQDVPDNLDNLAERIDFVARVCGAWDFGLLPLPITLKEILNNDWKKAVDETLLLTSCAYHLLRERHGLKPLPYLGPKFPHILNDPFLNQI